VKKLPNLNYGSEKTKETNRRKDSSEECIITAKASQAQAQAQAQDMHHPSPTH